MGELAKMKRKIYISKSVKITMLIIVILGAFIGKEIYYRKLAEVSTFRMNEEILNLKEGEGMESAIKDGVIDMCVKGLEDPEDKEQFKNIIIDSITSVRVGLNSTKAKRRYVEILENAFQDDTKVEWIYIPKTIKKIGANAFQNCDNLKKVSFEGTRAEWDSIEIADGNEDLLNAKIKYKQSEPKVSDYLN